MIVVQNTTDYSQNNEYTVNAQSASVGERPVVTGRRIAHGSAMQTVYQPPAVAAEEPQPVPRAAREKSVFQKYDDMEIQGDLPSVSSGTRSTTSSATASNGQTTSSSSSANGNVVGKLLKRMEAPPGSSSVST